MLFNFDQNNMHKINVILQIEKAVLPIKIAVCFFKLQCLFLLFPTVQR